MPRIEEGDDLLREGITCGNPGSLMFVAERAGKPQIALIGQTAQRSRDDVFDLQGRTDKSCKSQAIAATESSPLRDTVAELAGNVDACHSPRSAGRIS